MEAQHLEGFPNLANFISTDADAAIFRSFNELGASNLFYLQSHLNSMELELKRLDQEDFDTSLRLRDSRFQLESIGV